MSDEMLAVQLRGGDAAAFHMLSQRYAVRLVNFAAKVLGSTAQAEDEVQEVFIKLWQRPELFDADKARFKTWIHRVTLNRCLDHKRRRQPGPIEGLEDQLAAPQPSAADVMEAGGRDAAVRRAIDALPARQRAALALCHLEGLSNREAADILDLKIKALESLLSRARANLKQALTPIKEHLL